ncbi:Zn-dependent protease [Oxalobacteraceae bacterium CAVE-383]|nr:Zn-dependent protease [Oxalobacteraceae bacterium CAVE-383]
MIEGIDDIDAGAPIEALYFDGRSSRPHRVALSVDGGTARLSGDVQRDCELAALRVSERFRHAGRKVTYPDGAYLEIAAADSPRFNALLDATHFDESPVVRAQHNWRMALGALAGVVLLLAFGYFYLLPAASKLIADNLPLSVDRRIGDGALALLDRHVLQPSALPLARQQAIIERFNALAPPGGTGPVHGYKILFRKSILGPNAFTLPSGEIVMTDSLIALLKDDDSIMGVLAHELGHVHGRHLMRRLIQGSVIGGGVTLLFGDVSVVAANMSALLLDMHYSREAEREADDYAIAIFKTNGIPLSKLADVFEKLGHQGEEPIPYLASHPSSKERIAHIREGGRDGQ